MTELGADVDVKPWLARLRRDAEALAAAAEAGPLDAAVPGCPGWDLDRLLRHVGEVHRWAARIVAERVQSRSWLEREYPGPDDPAALVAHLREGAAHLHDVLASTPPEATFWAWGPAPSPVAFWARRQANETSMHRWDAESARGAPRPFAAGDAADLLDEWLTFITTWHRSPHGGGRSLRFLATDAGVDRGVLLGERAAPHRGDAGCTVRGTASDLYLLSMNRIDASRVAVDGDATALDAWREDMRF